MHPPTSRQKIEILVPTIRLIKTQWFEDHLSRKVFWTEKSLQCTLLFAIMQARSTSVFQVMI